MTVDTKHHQVGNSPMEQFVLLASGVRGAAATDVLKQALEVPGLYVFSELMDIPNIKEVNYYYNAFWRHHFNINIIQLVGRRRVQELLGIA